MISPTPQGLSGRQKLANADSKCCTFWKKKYFQRQSDPTEYGKIFFRPRCKLSWRPRLKHLREICFRTSNCEGMAPRMDHCTLGDFACKQRPPGTFPSCTKTAVEMPYVRNLHCVQKCLSGSHNPFPFIHYSVPVSLLFNDIHFEIKKYLASV